jgi:hypothetical protein
MRDNTRAGTGTARSPIWAADGGDGMKITIEVPDGTLVVIATYIYPDTEYNKMCVGTHLIDSNDIEKQKEVTE